MCYPLSPPDETDGPPGAIAIATMLQSLGKDVTLLTDRRAVEMTGAMVDDAVKTGGFELSSSFASAALESSTSRSPADVS